MKIKIIGILVCMLLIGTLLPASATVCLQSNLLPHLFGKTLYVGGSGPGNYSSIQDAIDNASDGDTIFVFNGTYGLAHSTIRVYKSINLIGENKVNTIINGTSIWVNVSEVMISSFTLQNNSPILLISSNNITITNNILNNTVGITMFYSDNNIFSENTFFNCGLLLWGYNNLVYNNTVNGKPLVYLESTTDKIIDDAGQVILVDCANVTINNLEISKADYAIQLYECSNCYLIENKLSNNAVGMFIANSTSNTILGNICLNNWMGSILIYAENNNISENHFENDVLNVALQGSNNNLFSKNNFIFKLSFFYIIRHFRKSVFLLDSDNKWDGNYWNRARVLPVRIWGMKTIRLFIYHNIPSLDIDWHPAKVPYDIY